MMFDYLRGRTTLLRVMLLLDSRIEIKPADHDVMTLLDRAAVTYQVVLTKADGLKPPALARKQEEVLAVVRTHPAAFPEIATTSAETGVGIPELRAVLAGLAG
jgi:GTP-binding protein